jgi:hypothetical protein
MWFFKLKKQIKMKRSILYVWISLLPFIFLTGCKKDFEDIKQNTNLPGQVPPALLLNGALFALHDEPFGDPEKWSQYFLINYDYYGNNRYDFGPGQNYYSTLKDVNKMLTEAINMGLPKDNAYDAMARFLKAYYYTKMSLEMGDIPMKEALKGTENLYPHYDAQKDVFIQAFSWLDSCNIELAGLKSGSSSASTLQGDFYYNNDLSKWQKLVNTFRLRLLIALSKREDDSDLKIKQQFAAIIGDPVTYPVMENAEDNLQFNYVYPTNVYPNNPGNFGYDALRDNCSETYVSLLTSFNDPRVYITCEPAQALVDSLGSSTDFRVFAGANAGEDLGAMYIKANSGYYSLLNRYHYYRTFIAEPTIEIGFPEMCFNIAEAINRGWINSGPLGNAEDYYEAGIKASMAFYQIPESGQLAVHFFKPGAGLSDANPYNDFSVAVDFNVYYNQPLVKYSGNNTTGLTQILQQKYLALFRHSGLESYFTYRRTGVPEFGTGPGTGNGGKIALRFQYMSNEKTTNPDNMNQALNSQGFGGNDDINGVMWILK